MIQPDENSSQNNENMISEILAPTLIKPSKKRKSEAISIKPNTEEKLEEKENKPDNIEFKKKRVRYVWNLVKFLLFAFDFNSN